MEGRGSENMEGKRLERDLRERLGEVKVGGVVQF